MHVCAKLVLSFGGFFELRKFRFDLFKWTYVGKIWEIFKTEFHIMFDCFSCHLGAENVDGILQAVDKQPFWCTVQSWFVVP